MLKCLKRCLVFTEWLDNRQETPLKGDVKGVWLWVKTLVP